MNARSVEIKRLVKNALQIEKNMPKKNASFTRKIRKK